ncbi:histidine kinase [Trinickia terrae]|uniref:Histidine kinase n=1 Tax=Trinickia terrae TaxID=2571161 RepID=A0A4U1I7C4_9BURK|nr:ATP-binding protein [Trinickia terrae]TKC89298.1 histidine kinase [Trinickia terrae]
MDTSIVVPIHVIASHAPSCEAIRQHDVDPLPPAGHLEARLATEREAAALRKRVRELAAELTTAQETARAYLAQELHDSVGAELTAARFALANAEHRLPADADAQCAEAIAVAQQALDAASEASRRIVDHLHARPLDAGIVSALSQWAEGFAARTRLRTSFVCAADVRLTQLPYGAALAIYRVAQEALSNVAKHAGASCADVRIETDRRHLTVIIEDDGRGIGRRARKDTSGFGLAGMRARCDAFGGKLRVISHGQHGSCDKQGRQSAKQAPSGTTVRARFAWESMLAAADTPRRSASLS